MARPPRADGLSVPRTVRLSPSELEMVKQAAAVNHQTQSDFMRDASLSAAGDCLELDPDARAVVIRIP